MRMLQLGVGAVGEVTARVAAAEPAVEKVILADVDETPPSRGGRQASGRQGRDACRRRR